MLVKLHKRGNNLHLIQLLMVSHADEFHAFVACGWPAFWAIYFECSMHPAGRFPKALILALSKPLLHDSVLHGNALYCSVVASVLYCSVFNSIQFIPYISMHLV